jgi:hypothetical protein
MATTSKIGILGTTLAAFVVLFILATAQGINVFDFIKKILNQILDTFKVLFTFQRPNEENEEDNEKRSRLQNEIQSVEIKPFDSPDLAVKVPMDIKTEKEIPMTHEDRTLQKIQEIKNEKNESHLETELPKPTAIMPVRRSLDRSIQVRSYVSDEDQDYIQTYPTSIGSSSVSNFQTIEVNSYANAGLTSNVYPSEINCLKPKDLDAVPTTYYQFYQV